MKDPYDRIILRQATLADLPLLEHWDEQPHVTDSDPNDDWNWAVELDRFPDWREQLVAELDLPIKKTQACATLNGSRKLQFMKKVKAPYLKPHHEIARIEWAKKHMYWSTEWTRMVFSDEKKFNLDGPDSCHFYWHDLSQEKKFEFSRSFGGGSLMVWAAFSAFGKTPSLKVRGRMNLAKYVEMIEDVLITLTDNKMVGDFIF